MNYQILGKKYDDGYFIGYIIKRKIFFLLNYLEHTEFKNLHFGGLQACHSMSSFLNFQNSYNNLFLVKIFCRPL